LAKPQRSWRNQVCNDVSSYSTDKNWGHNLQIQNEFDGVTVKFTGGHREWRNTPISDLDGIGAFKGPLFTNTTLLNGLPQSLLGLIQPAATAAFLASQPVPTVQQNLYDTQNDRRQKQTSAELEFSAQNDHLDWVVGVLLVQGNGFRI